MATQFFVFGENQDALSARLAAAGSSLDKLASEFVELPWPFSVRDGSNNPWKFEDDNGEAIPLADEDGNRGFGLPFAGERAEVEAFLQALKKAADDHGDEKIAQSAGVDFSTTPLTVAPSWQHWCANAGLGHRFATRGHAERLIRTNALRDAGLTGKDVKIVLVDQGLSRGYVNSLGFGARFGDDLIFSITLDGITRVSGQAATPYEKAPRTHSSMMVRSLLHLAPGAKIYDFPLIPPQISDVTSFALSAIFPFFVLRFIAHFIPGPWIFVNAWGIDDRFGEDIWGEYTNRRTHGLNVQIGALGQAHDVVFAAGNSGQFCPDPEAGPYDRGPGQSILGANGHPNVTSVGAVRADALWIGTSSQGPGPDDFDFGDQEVNQKPDYCAPSWFVEAHDAALRSGGTSAATAVAAGALAALREKWKVDQISPADLRAFIRTNARRDWHTQWNGRMGDGIIDVAATIDALPAPIS